jgi:hypothetical protein
MELNILKIFAFALPGLVACGPHSQVGGSGGKPGHAGAAGSAGHAGKGGHAGTSGHCRGASCPPPACRSTRRFVAHAPGDLEAKYTVEPRDSSEWTCFYFKNPFYGTKTLVASETPIVDNTAFTHHWYLFGTTETRADGEVVPHSCIAPLLSQKPIVSAWAPGVQPIVYPPDVGLGVADYPMFVLQVTYNNPSAAAGDDASGVEFCTTDEERPNVAGTIMLGTELSINIPAGVRNHPGARGTCTNPFRGTATGPATIIASSPRMNILGSGMTTERFRNGRGLLGYVTNVPLDSWRFDEHARHLNYEPTGTRIELRPGEDQLVTTCYYSNPRSEAVGYGVEPTDEVCYNLVTAYPISQLRSWCGFPTFGP